MVELLCSTAPWVLQKLQRYRVTSQCAPQKLETDPGLREPHIRVFMPPLSAPVKSQVQLTCLPLDKWINKRGHMHAHGIFRLEMKTPFRHIRGMANWTRCCKKIFQGCLGKPLGWKSYHQNPTKEKSECSVCSLGRDKVCCLPRSLLSQGDPCREARLSWKPSLHQRACQSSCPGDRDTTCKEKAAPWIHTTYRDRRGLPGSRGPRQLPRKDLEVLFYELHNCTNLVC